QLPPYAQCLDTPFQCFPERPGLAATTWAIFADQTVNPMQAVLALACTPRPDIILATGSGGPGLPVAVSETGLGTLLRSLQFAGGGNAVIDGPGLPPGRLPPITIPVGNGGAVHFPFTVRQQVSGIATTAQFA